MNAIPRSHDFAVRDDPTNLPKTATRPARRGILHRVFEAVRQWRQRQVDREIARFLGSDGHLTDESERRLFEHLTSNCSFGP